MTTKLRTRIARSTRTRRHKAPLARRVAWTAIAASAAWVAGRATKTVLDRGWQALRDEDPPEDPLARGTNWPTVVSWTAVTAAVMSLAGLAATRGAAAGWTKTTGHRPPRR
ncbi:MAG: DUF4235 domain-containing protein [Gemmatimonadaceae bacterium]